MVARLEPQRAFLQRRRLGDRLADRLDGGRNDEIAVPRGIREPRYYPQPFRPRLIRRVGQVLLALPRGQKLDVSGPERLEIVEPGRRRRCGHRGTGGPMQGFRDMGGQQAQRTPTSPRLSPAPAGPAQSGEHLRNHLVSCQIHSTVLLTGSITNGDTEGEQDPSGASRTVSPPRRTRFIHTGPGIPITIRWQQELFAAAEMVPARRSKRGWSLHRQAPARKMDAGIAL